MNSILVMAHAADDKKHNIINILVVFGAYAAAKNTAIILFFLKIEKNIGCFYV